jgi:two-component system CheB/CheR fusion protein
VIEGAVISFTDITEMKQAQTALRENADLRRLAVVVRDAHDAVMVQDLQGRITAWNPAATRMYGWSEAEALTMNIHDLIAKSQHAQELASVQRLGRGQVLEPYRSQRIAKDGHGIEVWVTASVLVTDSGASYAIATTEKLAEEARRA